MERKRIAPIGSAPSWRVVGWIWIFALAVLAALLSGCLSGDMAERCREACAPGIMAEVDATFCRCHAAPEACSIDRLLVTPVPPARKGAANGR